jgi:fumarylacetoacetase
MNSPFIEIARDSDFPLQNLPYGIFISGSSGKARAAVAIGDHVLDLSLLEKNGLFPFLPGDGFFSRRYLNDFMALSPELHSETRRRIRDVLTGVHPFFSDHPDKINSALFPREAVQLLLPVQIGDYTDFYSSRQHAENVGRMFRGAANALMPNWLHLPVAYHGRSSSIVISGTPIVRPSGQVMPPDGDHPRLQPTAEMDFELEMGFLIGAAARHGQPVSVSAAPAHIFGLMLVNDWSARDIQRWEYQPLGPFLSKNFATSVSPWIVPMEALEPFRSEGPAQSPEPLEYLRTDGNPSFNIELEIWLKTARAREAELISRTNFNSLYWNMYQQLAHHTVNGCTIRTGDLMASGTISGEQRDQMGSMLEITGRGTMPLQLKSGETRGFLDDGDEVTLRAVCRGDGYRIGFGDVRGRIVPAAEQP